MNFARILEASAEQWPEAVAAESELEAVTFSQLNALSNRLARALRQRLGIGTGSKVFVLLDNGIDFLAAFFSAGKLGSVLVPCSPYLTVREVRTIWESSEPSAILACPEAYDKAATLAADRSVPIVLAATSRPQADTLLLSDLTQGMPAGNLDEQFDPSHVGVIVYTSGTTSQPKGVMWTHHSIVANQIIPRMVHRLQADDVVMLRLPFFHGWAMMFLAMAIGAGSKLLVQKSDTPLPKSLQFMAAKHATFLAGPSPVFVTLMKWKSDEVNPALRYLRQGSTGSSPLDPEVFKAFEQRFGVPLLEGYGMTEVGIICSNRLDAPRRPGSVGLPAPLTEVRIVDEALKEVGVGELGQIVVRGPGLMKGYYRNSENPLTEDGWLLTGDVGRQDADGYFYVVDRIKDMVNLKGEKVYCAEVEEVLKLHPYVADAAVVGISAAGNEQLIAFVVAKDGKGTSDTHRILDHCRKNLASFKVPRRVMFVDKLPRNAMGRLLRKQLRSEIESRQLETAVS